MRKTRFIVELLSRDASPPLHRCGRRRSRLGDDGRLDDHETVVLIDDTLELATFVARNHEEPRRVCPDVGVLGGSEQDLVDARGI
jgi:hypothetical protein